MFSDLVVKWLVAANTAKLQGISQHIWCTTKISELESILSVRTL